MLIWLSHHGPSSTFAKFLVLRDDAEKTRDLKKRDQMKQHKNCLEKMIQLIQPGSILSTRKKVLKLFNTFALFKYG